MPIKYVEPVYRPPAEADSVIFQVAHGCPHNTCLFCPMYKPVRYRLRDEAELLDEIAGAGREMPWTSRVFLADGDVMALSFVRLERILTSLNAAFPKLARVSLYANGSSILAKSKGQLAALKELKLSTVYVGLETGDEELLRLVEKGETAAGMVEAVKLAQELGLRASVMVLLGLGGVALSERHADLTAIAVNAMKPKLLSALRFVQVPGMPMFDGYKPVSEHGAVAELRRLVAGLELDGTVFRANHASNPVPLGGRFPKDKLQLLAELDGLLRSGRLDAGSPGRLPLWL